MRTNATDTYSTTNFQLPTSQASSSLEEHGAAGFPASDTIHMLDYIEVILKRKTLIFNTSCVAFLLALVISLIIPKSYSSTALIIPPQQDSSGMMSAFIGSMGNLGGVAGDLLGKASPADMYVSMLNSDAVSDAIIDRYNLMEAYHEKYRLDAYKTLEKYIHVSVGKKDGIVSITAEDKDPKRAAAIANTYVDELDKMVTKMNVAGSGQNRSFFEERLAKAKAELSQAEDALKRFQSKNMAIDIMDQAKVTVGAVAQLQAQLAVQEVQLETLRRQLTDSSQEVKNLKATIANIKSQVAKLEGNAGGGSIPSVGSVPGLAQEYFRLFREFKIKEAVVEILTKQFEMNILSESKGFAGIQVIQPARIPDKKSKPKRSIIVLASTFAAGFGAIFYVIILKALEEMSLEEKRQWQRIRNMLPAMPGIRRS